MGTVCSQCGQADDAYPAADPERVIENILRFLNQRGHDHFDKADFQIIREYHHCADTFIRLIETSKKKPIQEEELRSCFPNMQIAQEIYNLLLERRYDFVCNSKKKPRKEGEFRWSKLYEDVVCRKRTNAELKVHELKGVTWHKRYKSFAAKVEYDHKTYFLGFFPDRYAAARAYDDKLRQLAWDHPADERRLRKKMNFDEQKKRWWYREADDDMKMGPYSWKEIEEKARKRLISKDCCISDEKYSKDWLRLGDLQISGGQSLVHVVKNGNTSSSSPGRSKQAREKNRGKDLFDRNDRSSSEESQDRWDTKRF